MNINPIKLTLKALFAFSLFILLTNCGIWDPADARKIDPNVQKRAEKNLKEGKGFRLNEALKKKVQEASNLQLQTKCGVPL